MDGAVARDDGARLRARVSPALPLQVERLTNRAWRTVATARGVFDRSLRPGSYRVTVRGSLRYAGETSAPVAVHSA